MSGGVAFVLDRWGRFAERCNRGMVDLEPVEDREDIALLRRLLRQHLEWTGSPTARWALSNLDDALPRFVKVMPHDLKRVLREREVQERAG
jgi:glutamate synthase domain-containing protein 3